MAKNETKEAENVKPGLTDNMPDFSQWTPEQIGYAPYWWPEAGKWFLGTPINRDERDPDFIRYLFIAGAPTPCRRGPNEAMAKKLGRKVEDVLVATGETFSISVYASLAPLFDEYLQFAEDTGVPVLCRIMAKETVPTSTAGREVWLWEGLISPEQKKLLTEWRTTRKAHNVKRLANAAPTRPALES